MNLLFDLDGTLAQPFEAFRGSIQAACQAGGFPVPSNEILRTCIGPPLHISIATILRIPPAQQTQFLEDFRIHHVREGLALYSFFPEVVGALTRLHAKHKIYVATSKPIGMTLQLIANLGVDELFDGMYGSELNGVRSNKGELITYILKQERLVAAQTVMIGDREHDILGAKANGVRGFGVMWGFGSREELEAAGAEQIFTSWLHLEKSLNLLS